MTKTREVDDKWPERIWCEANYGWTTHPDCATKAARKYIRADLVPAQAADPDKVLVPREPTDEWLDKVVIGARVWPANSDEPVPRGFREAVRGYHKAMLSASADSATEPAQAQNSENALHASAPEGYKCADCYMDKVPCPTCYEIWWQKRHPNSVQVVVKTENVTEEMLEAGARVLNGPSHIYSWWTLKELARGVYLAMRGAKN